ncbi:MAG: hypothetical protein HZB38_01970 [Planctomycetes bacterium]|nr:hypothetical protein [Planctomycetota bacterium]
MKKTVTSIRCVPRFGYDYAQVRSIDLDLPEGWDDDDLRTALTHFFAYRSIADAVFAVEADDDGFFAIINDEAYQHEWGEALF